MLLIGCAGPLVHQRTVGFVDPPRDQLQASLATDRIKVSDVLQLKLADGSTASATVDYQVGPDGSIHLSGHGKVQVAGKTLEEARQAVREALAASSAVQRAFELEHCEYYLVTVTSEGVQDLTRVPLRGTVTVKDALSGIPRLSSKMIWIARPVPGRAAGDSTGLSLQDHVLPVDWEGVWRGEDTSTNHALRPGDWLFVADEPAKGVGRLFSALTSMLPSAGRSDSAAKGAESRAAEKPGPSSQGPEATSSPSTSRGQI
jgi:protein involved in polysaccharide export with SLBB domain